MKQDLTISKLISKTDMLAKLKNDYLMPANELKICSDGVKSRLEIGSGEYMLQERAARQLADIIGIPYNYYQRLVNEYPDLLDMNVNTLLASVSKNKLVRTLGGSARAILSDRYRLFEHETVLKALLPIIDEYKGLQVVSCSLNDEKMYIKLISRCCKMDVKVGDTIAFGAVVVNSEVGMSSISLTPFIMRLVCTNGMALPVLGKTSTKKIHLGKQIRSIDEYEQLYNTENADLSLLLSNQLKTALDSDYHRELIQQMRDASEINISKPLETIEQVAKIYSLTPSEKAQVLLHFLTDKDSSLYGMVNAVTRTAQDAVSYARASELERLGAQLLYDGINAVKRDYCSNKLLLTA